MMFDGVDRPATVEDLYKLVNAPTTLLNGRHLDCVAWDLLGWRMHASVEHTGWPCWQRSEQVVEGKVPEFHSNIQHTLELVAASGDCPKEFLVELAQVLLEDPDVLPADFPHVLPVAAITLWVMRCTV